MTGPDLVAAVSSAGAFGILQAQFAPPPGLREEIRKTRDLTDKPFGVNFLLHFPVEEQVAACLEEDVSALSFFWGDPSPFVERAHDAGKLVIHQVGSVEDAARSAEAGVDLIIAQGVEAGGHVAGVISTMVLVPQVVDAVSPTPVVGHTIIAGHEMPVLRFMGMPLNLDSNSWQIHQQLTERAPRVTALDFSSHPWLIRFSREHQQRRLWPVGG